MATSDRQFVRLILYNDLPYLPHVSWRCALPTDVLDLSWIPDPGVWQMFQFSLLATWEHEGPAAEVVHGLINPQYYAVKSL